jgi:putative FmdB family regulatory protein
MPIYEYQCRECGTTSEYLIGITGSESISCKLCGSSAVEKVLSASAVLTKMPRRAPGKTCCGADERCATPPSGTGKSCCKS